MIPLQQLNSSFRLLGTKWKHSDGTEMQVTAVDGNYLVVTTGSQTKAITRKMLYNNYTEVLNAS